ncbi:AbrB/MazE/SpoVT family DNA-binding domain-containing protein [Pseudanabaena catenata USMAC16]|uniref:SpoVT-AbrB domain-containing protein n=2 Tax=Pseudanabaena TaxID=1152 RepID=L8MY29_9CYAN|nr:MULTISPECIES: AbrB/MazE/SpoVT family DNA-binding domain-containing protein [Pseudanabaena]ELS30883.1 hypothetical protein Pse7429DRAFT_3977 [Pseudanabaena biceps PCC 7429]MDG3496856.1 AbrB/MazE/SpoVT family DNA-binding domain-containing protein [Pseudanabaena catenata USMAC16]
MSTVIRTRIIKIGNSQGIRIPKTLLEQGGIQTEDESLYFHIDYCADDN